MTQQLAKGFEEKTPSINRQTHAMLEYLVTVHGTFVEHLLNRNWKLSRHNIKRETATLNEILSYFSDWIREINKVRKDEKLSAAETGRYFIATYTYKNQLTLVRGFLGYVSCILDYSEEEKCIHDLQSKQFSIESFFLFIRHMQNNRTDLYAGGVQQEHMFHHLSAKKKN